MEVSNRNNPLLKTHDHNHITRTNDVYIVAVIPHMIIDAHVGKPDTGMKQYASIYIYTYMYMNELINTLV